MSPPPQSSPNMAVETKKTELRDKSISWYSPKIKDLSPAARGLLEKYSKIPASEVEDHVYKMRDKAWGVFPYPCIGEFRFLDLAISALPSYTTILRRLQTPNSTFLDLGCCFGQDLRKLVYDGAVQENLYGCDLDPEFFSLGYELFRDRETLKSTFIAADILAPKSELDILQGKVDVIYAGSFLHLFNYETQVDVCKRIVRLLNDKEGSVVLGRQAGNRVAGEYVQEVNIGGKTWRHSEDSFKGMWERVGRETGTEWRVECEMKAFEWMGGQETERMGRIGMLGFEVWRV